MRSFVSKLSLSLILFASLARGASTAAEYDLSKTENFLEWISNVHTFLKRDRENLSLDGLRSDEHFALFTQLEGEADPLKKLASDAESIQLLSVLIFSDLNALRDHEIFNPNHPVQNFRRELINTGALYYARVCQTYQNIREPLGGMSKLKLTALNMLAQMSALPSLKFSRPMLEVLTATAKATSHYLEIDREDAQILALTALGNIDPQRVDTGLPNRDAEDHARISLVAKALLRLEFVSVASEGTPAGEAASSAREQLFQKLFRGAIGETHITSVPHGITRFEAEARVINNARKTLFEVAMRDRALRVRYINELLKQARLDAISTSLVRTLHRPGQLPVITQLFAEIAAGACEAASNSPPPPL